MDTSFFEFYDKVSKLAKCTAKLCQHENDVAIKLLQQIQTPPFPKAVALRKQYKEATKKRDSCERAQIPKCSAEAKEALMTILEYIEKNDKNYKTNSLYKKGKTILSKKNPKSSEYESYISTALKLLSKKV